MTPWFLGKVAFKIMSYNQLSTVSKFSVSLVSGQRSRSTSFFPRKPDQRSLNGPRITCKSARKYGIKLRKIINSLFQGYELFEVTPVTFQCKQDCPLNAENVSVDIPHDEVALQEMLQLHFSMSRVCYQKYVDFDRFAQKIKWRPY